LHFAFTIEPVIFFTIDIRHIARYSDETAMASFLSNKEKQAFAEGKASMGDEIAGVLQVLGNVQDEIADAQMLMCESLEAS